jgi:hypothetical protein
VLGQLTHPTPHPSRPSPPHCRLGTNTISRRLLDDQTEVVSAREPRLSMQKPMRSHTQSRTSKRRVVAVYQCAVLRSHIDFSCIVENGSSHSFAPARRGRRSRSLGTADHHSIR